MVGLVLALNRVLPRPRVGGRASPRAYWEWERATGEALVASHLGPSGDLAGRAVLDVGCGLGGKSVAYGVAGARSIAGIDLAIDNAHACQRFAADGDARASCRLDFVAADAARLPFADASFDTVVANDVMEHLAEPAASLGEMARVTRPGGAVWLFFTPYYSPLGSHLYDYIRAPWCNLLLDRRRMEVAIRRVVTQRLPGDPEAIEREVTRVMDFYDHGLNRMSIRRFQRLVAAESRLAITRHEHRPPRFQALRPLASLPFLCELLTGQAIFRLERRG
ncbi:MAG: class I SAM-dependent methyltransferase [Candidatus Eiseniibacteriota bacterium]